MIFEPFLEENTKAIALLFWPKMAHFHHFSICNQNQSDFKFGHVWVIFEQNTKAIALVLAKNGSFSSLFKF